MVAKHQQGFHLLVVALAIVILGAIVMVGVYVAKKRANVALMNKTLPH